jgi:hypothetical protein
MTPAEENAVKIVTVQAGFRKVWAKLSSSHSLGYMM